MEHDEEDWRGKPRPGDLESARPTRPAASIDCASESRRGGEEARDEFGRPRYGRRAASVAQLSKHEHVLVGRIIISFPPASSGHACENGNAGKNWLLWTIHVVAGLFASRARQQRKCAIARALLAAGATVDAQRDHPRNTPLLTAIIYGRVEMTRLLCQAGADVNYRRAIEDGTDFPLVLALHGGGGAI